MPKILGLEIVATSYAKAVEQSLVWARSHESRALFFANVHVVMEAFDNSQFRESLNQADMVCPDGVPLVWALRALGESGATRVYGPDMTVDMLDAAEKARTPVGFYGASQAVLDKLVATVRRTHPGLPIVYMESPPFRDLTEDEDAAVVERIMNSEARLLFVGLGCPRQERWVMEHRGRIPAVMFGVGAAFDFLAGTKPQAPRWIMRCGMEWAFRLASEPRRLAHRYLKHNPRFVAYFLQQWWISRFGGHQCAD